MSKSDKLIHWDSPDNHAHDNMTVEEIELSYWGDCTNTFDEEQKHYVYARLMGITIDAYWFDLGGVSVIDIGGGPVSMLLKSKNMRPSTIWDPIRYPDWTRARYAVKNIEVIHRRGEDLTDTGWDEAWIYNCLQHVDDPRRIIENAKRAAKRVRIFEWVDLPVYPGHPHSLSKEFLDDCMGSKGIVTVLGERGCFGKGYSHIIDT